MGKYDGYPLSKTERCMERVIRYPKKKKNTEETPALPSEKGGSNTRLVEVKA